MNVSPVVLDDLLGERQTEPAAAGLGREERIKQLRYQLVCDANAVVLHGDLDAVARRPGPHDDLDTTLGRNRVSGVTDQVDETLPDLVGIDVADRIFGVQRGVEVDV